jgi:hypothetical protein
VSYNPSRLALRSALLALAAGVVLSPSAGEAAPRRSHRPSPPAIQRVETPLGLQGSASLGSSSVVIPFAFDRSNRSFSNVDVEVGVDRNGDGEISDDEFRGATEDRLDPRDTRSNRKPQLFRAGAEGAVNAFVWRSSADLGGGRWQVDAPLLTDQGRFVPDPAHPDSALLDHAARGVQVRMRSRMRWQRRTIVGPWVSAEPFSVDNDSPPRMRIDGASVRAVGADAASRVDLAWTAFDADSEDLDGDGLFDPGEDRNGNGVFDRVQVGVAFDFHYVTPGEDVAGLLPQELERLRWQPCTRAAGEGDSDSFRQTSDEPDRRVFATSRGTEALFVWDVRADLGPDADAVVLLRARTVDAQKSLSEFTYVEGTVSLPGAPPR